VAAVFAFYLQVTEGSPSTISDDRVRSLDNTPVAGRGYSIGTNSFQSTCLMVEQTSTPSYNYDFTFTDFSETNNREAEMAEQFSGTLSYNKLKEKMDALEDASTNGAMGALGKTRSETRIIASIMKIDRYYSSVKEEMSELSPSAKILLDKQDYIGFFKSCGPNYVRGIRRSQELTIIYTFLSPSKDRASEFAAELKSEKGNTAFSKLSKFSGIVGSLDIDILAYGLGLNQDGLGSLTSNTLSDVNDVKKFAFKSFTTSNEKDQIGMVYGMEIVPWVDNTAFQVASKLLDENVNIPLPYSLIPKIVNGTCVNIAFHADMNDYCCEGTMLFDPATSAYLTSATALAQNLRICKPLRTLEKSVVKNNMSNNGEFVARLDAVIRDKMNQLFTLEKCVNSVNSIPQKNEYNFLKSQVTATYDSSIEGVFTVTQLKMALDPLADYGLIKQMGKELDEYIEMYYRPCTAALFGSTIGTSPDVDAQYFMAYGWLEHSACAHLTCLAENMRWNRDIVGNRCVPSVIVGSNSWPEVVPAIPGGAAPPVIYVDDNCSRDDSNVCKYLTNDLVSFVTAAKTCWGTITPFYLMNHFCMPEITRHVATGAALSTLTTAAVSCTLTTPTYRRLKESPAGANRYLRESSTKVVQNKQSMWLTDNIEEISNTFLE